MLHIGDENVFGAEVNAASKLGEDTARASEILATENLVQHCKEITNIVFEEIKEIPPGATKAYKLIKSS